MKKQCFFLVFAVLILSVVPRLAGKGWMKVYPGTEEIVLTKGFWVEPTIDGGYAVGGGGGGYGNFLWLLKTDSSGDTLWTNLLDDPIGSPIGDWSPGEALCVRQLSDGGYIVTGEAYTSNSRDLLLVRFTSEGDTLWTRFYGGKGSDGGRSIALTPDGGYIVTGKKSDIEGIYSDLWLLETDSLGDTLWTRTYGTERDDFGWYVESTSDGGYVVCGTKDKYGPDEYSLWLLKTDADGDTQWTRSWGERQCRANSVCETEDGGYFIVGQYNYPMMNNMELWVLKTDASGDTQWTRTYGGSLEDWGAYGEETSDGGYIVTGWTETSGPRFHDLWLLKLSPDGDTQWTRTFGGWSYDKGWCVRQTSDGGYIIAGYTNSYSADCALWLIKTDSLGYVSIEESSSVFLPPSWDIASPVTSVGGQIILRYENYPKGFRASVYDATGRKVDSIQSSSPSGTITWPVTPVTHPLPPGVYIIREEQGTKAKVVLVK